MKNNMTKYLNLMIRTFVVFLGLVGFSSPALAEEVEDRRQFSSQRVFDLEFAHDPQISPDGKTIVYARRSMDKFQDAVVGRLWLVDARSGRHRPLANAEFAASSARWSPSGDRLVYLTSKDGKPEMRVHFIDSGQSYSIAQFEHGPSAPAWSPDGSQIVFSKFVPAKGTSFTSAPSAPEGAQWSEPVRVFDDLQFRRDGRGYLKKGVNHIFVLDAQGGTPRQVTRGENGFYSPKWLDDSSILVVGNDVDDPELDPIESELYRVDLVNLERKAITERDGPDHSPAVSADGKTIAWLGYDDKLKAYQQTDVFVMDVSGGEPKNISADFDRSIGAIAWQGSRLIAQAQVDGEIHLLSSSGNGRFNTLATDLGGTSFGRPYVSGSFSVSKNAIAYTQGDATDLANVAYLSGSKARTLTDLNRDLKAQTDFAPIEEIKVKSRFDGREIEAWVALPKNFKADGSFPMILEIHGGPFAMYGSVFSAEIQRFAAEGYVTVYANPRGSTGYGEEFAQLIDRKYPSQDHDDLMSVVDYLVDEQYVDESRLFITGGSGGGVLTAWAVGKTDRFAAAATIKPVINWATMALSADIARFVSRHWLRAQPWEDPELYWRLSPISLVGNVTTPTMVMVGEADWRTPTWEAEQYYTALKVQKVDTVLVRIPGASHSIASRPSRLIAKVDNIMGWFKKYDKALELDEIPRTTVESN